MLLTQYNSCCRIIVSTSQVTKFFRINWSLMSPESMNARSSVMFSEWNDLHPTPSAQSTHHGQDFRACLRFHTCWMYVLHLIFFISGNFYFSFVSTLLAYITIPQNKRKTTIIWDKKLTTTHATTSYIPKIRAGIYNTLGLQKLTTTYATTSYIHEIRAGICKTLGLQKVVCPCKGLVSDENDWNFVSEGKWLQQQGSRFNKVLMLRGPLY